MSPPYGDGEDMTSKKPGQTEQGPWHEVPREEAIRCTEIKTKEVMQMAEPLLLRASEVAAVLGIGRTKVFELLRTGDLPAVRLGRCVRVPRAALAMWIAERTS